MKTFYYRSFLRINLWLQSELEYTVKRTVYMVKNVDSNVPNAYPTGKDDVSFSSLKISNFNIF